MISTISLLVSLALAAPQAYDSMPKMPAYQAPAYQAPVAVPAAAMGDHHYHDKGYKATDAAQADYATTTTMMYAAPAAATMAPVYAPTMAYTSAYVAPAAATMAAYTTSTTCTETPAAQTYTATPAPYAATPAAGMTYTTTAGYVSPAAATNNVYSGAKEAGISMLALVAAAFAL